MSHRIRSEQTTPIEVAGMPLPGDVIEDKYALEHLLGQGGMGVVFAARHLLTHQRVALKFLRLHPAHAVEQTARFLNEARAAVQIQSEHVGRVVDVGTLGSGTPYMVMEFLDGRDLGAIVSSEGPLGVEEAVGYVLQACEALAEAHALGIVHRDLKPANLFLSRRRDGSPLVKVLDFGISRLDVGADEGAARLTQTRGALGSPLYMSPEQLLTPKDIDARADLWSLGVVLYELLSGAWPFEAETQEGLVVEIVTKAGTPLGVRREGLPPDLLAIVERCLQKDRARRFGSIGELAAALGPFASAEAQISVARTSRELVAGRMSRSEIVPPHASSPFVAAPPQEARLLPERSTQQGWDAQGTPTPQRAPGASPARALAMALGAICIAASLLALLIRGVGRDGSLAASPPPAPSVGLVSATFVPVDTPAAVAPSAPPPSLDLTPVVSVAAPAKSAVPARTAKAGATGAPLPPARREPTDFGGK